MDATGREADEEADEGAGMEFKEAKSDVRYETSGLKQAME